MEIKSDANTIDKMCLVIIVRRFVWDNWNFIKQILTSVPNPINYRQIGTLSVISNTILLYVLVPSWKNQCCVVFK